MNENMVDFGWVYLKKFSDQSLKSKFYQESEHKPEMLQVIKGILAHAMDPEKITVAERWMLGEHLDIEDLIYLGIENDLSMPFMAEEMLKVIATYLKNGVILMFDDIDKTYDSFNTFGALDDDEDIDDDDTGPLPSSPASVSNEQPSFFSLLYTLGEQIRNIKMVITLQEENCESFMRKFPRPSKIAIHPGLDIPSYTPQDTKHYYLTAIEAYMKKHGSSSCPRKTVLSFNRRND